MNNTVAEMAKKLVEQMKDNSPEKRARAKKANDALPKYPKGDTHALFYRHPKNKK